MLEPVDVTRQFLQTVIRIIGRKTSEEYAAVTIRTMLKKLQPRYPFFQDMQIRDTRFQELETSVSVLDTLNSINPKEIGNALKDLLKTIMNSMGKTAGYFFIREIREKIGVDYDDVLAKSMDVDLTLLQSMYIVEKKTYNLLHIEKSDVVRRVLKTLIELVEKQTSKTFALEFMARRIEALRQFYPFLGYVRISDVRVTLGSDEVAVQPEVDSANPMELKKALQSILDDTDTALMNLGRTIVTSDLKTHLTAEYLAKLEEFGITIIGYTVGYDAMFRQIIKTLVDVLGKPSTEAYAIQVVNQLLRKIEGVYGFLKNVKIDPATDQNVVYHISIMTNIDTISETDARHAIQHLLVEIVDSLGEDAGDQFIQEFKSSLDKKYLSKIEGIGVNLHMIELHHELVGEKERPPQRP